MHNSLKVKVVLIATVELLQNLEPTKRIEKTKINGGDYWLVDRHSFAEDINLRKVLANLFGDTIAKLTIKDTEHLILAITNIDILDPAGDFLRKHFIKLNNIIYYDDFDSLEYIEDYLTYLSITDSIQLTDTYNLYVRREGRDAHEGGAAKGANTKI